MAPEPSRGGKSQPRAQVSCCCGLRSWTGLLLRVSTEVCAQAWQGLPQRACPHLSSTLSAAGAHAGPGQWRVGANSTRKPQLVPPTSPQKPCQRPAQRAPRQASQPRALRSWGHHRGSPMPHGTPHLLPLPGPQGRLGRGQGAPGLSGPPASTGRSPTGSGCLLRNHETSWGWAPGQPPTPLPPPQPQDGPHRGHPCQRPGLADLTPLPSASRPSRAPGRRAAG